VFHPAWAVPAWADKIKKNKRQKSRRITLFSLQFDRNRQKHADDDDMPPFAFSC
jgi:hypothetical protein